MFAFNLKQFADTRTCSCQKTNNKVPIHFPILLKAIFKIQIICLADDILQEWFLLDFDRSQFPFVFLDTFQIAVYCTDAKIDRLWFVIFNQVNFVLAKIFTSDTVIPFVILLYGI